MSDSGKERKVSKASTLIYLHLVSDKKLLRHSFFFKFLKIFYLFIFGYARAFSSCGEQGLLFIAECRLLIAVASLVAEHGL